MGGAGRRYWEQAARGWLRRNGWWRKEHWSFELKFTEETEKRLDRDDFPVLQLQDVVEYVTHVQRFITSGDGVCILFDAMKSSKPSLVQYISLQHDEFDEIIDDSLEDDLISLAIAIEGGRLQTLECLQLYMGYNNVRLANAMASGGLPSLKTLSLRATPWSADAFKEYTIALRSGNLPNLSCLDISSKGIRDENAKSLGLAIRSRELKNLAELDLSWTCTADEGLIALADSLHDGVANLLPNLSFLRLTANSFTEVGVLSLSEALRSGKLPSLSHLDMSINNLGDKGVKSLALAIRSGELQNLAEIHLNNVGITDEGLIALTDSLHDGVASLLPNLSFLGLKGNSFTEVGVLSLSEALRSGKLPSLSHLDMSINNLGEKGAKSLALAIRSGELQNLAEIHLNNVGITDEGLIALADSLHDGVASLLPNLSFLGLKGNSFTEVGVLSLSEALRSGKLPSLSHLDMSINNLGEKGAKSLALAIRSGELKNLAEIHLNNIGITDEGLIALVDSLHDGIASLLPNLTFLELSNKPYKKQEFQKAPFGFAFGFALMSKHYKNSFTEVGVLSLAEALKSGHLDSLKFLDVQDTLNPSETVATALVSAFSSNRYLTVDLKYEWYKFPELDRRREQLTERNCRSRDILGGLVSVTKVQATIGKVYICGNPEVGKTTLRRTLQRSYWKSLISWERRPHVEKRTRGIDVSQLSSKRNKPDENPITLLMWDMAGQEDFHLVHNAFFPDLGLAEGKATTFVVVCSSKESLQNSTKQLEYWLRYIGSSCDKTTPSSRQVFVVMNNFGRDRKKHRNAEQWKVVLEGHRDKFEQYLKIQTNLFLMDVRKFQQVNGLKSCLFEHSRKMLRSQEVPNICHVIEKNLGLFSQQSQQFPVLHWTEFVQRVSEQLKEYWPEGIIEAATKYLNEAGVVIYIVTEGVQLVVMDPSWFCREIIGKVFLPKEMVSPRELLFREQVDQSTGCISTSSFKKFFKSLEGEWNDAQVDDMIAILLWLGLCYKGKDENVFIPALIAEKGTPADPWCVQTQVEHVRDQWVMGFSVRHQKSEIALAPISLWHKFQVGLAQGLKFDSEVPDNDFVADKYFMTFVKDYMNVIIEVDANLVKPTFEEISILVKPMSDRDELAATERKQCQVDLADDLVERLLNLWNQVCPGVDYELKVIWPWPASCSRPTDRPERNVEVAKVKKWVLERGVGRKMQWVVGSGDPITEDQLLSTKDKRKLGAFSMSSTPGIKGEVRQVNDSVFELYKPDVNPKIQIVFFHGLQMEEYSDPHLSTWQSGDGLTIWPQTWLVEDISGAHVLSISYSEGLRYRSDGSLDMYLIAENLLSDLLQQDDVRPGIEQVPHCPVVLVGHSIGGIVIKQLCCLAHNRLNRSRGSERAKLEKFLKNIGGVFYYATPHQGSEVAKILAKRIASPLLTYFETLSKDSARLSSEFEAMCKVNYKDWMFAGVGEGLPTNLGPLKARVVPEASARCEEFNIVEVADHFSVCRPRSKTARSFYKLRDFIKEIVSKASDAEEINPANPLLGSASLGDVLP